MEQSSNDATTVEDVFNDFKGRRSGVLQALTTDSEEFYKECDPDDVHLCLFGFPDGQWEVNLPSNELYGDLPDPTMGINFSRDDNEMDDWLSLIARHSDAWLLHVAFFMASKLKFSKAERLRLFNMINALPTVSAVVREAVAKRQQNTQSSAQNDSRNKPKLVMEQSSYNGKTVEDIFNNFKGRRSAVLKALTTDSDEFYKQCDANTTGLCLFGFPDGRWEVKLPSDELLLDLPDPTRGINLSRDVNRMDNWLSLIAIRGDAWLLSVAFFLASNADFGKDEREQLFHRINALPTVLEVVREAAAKRQQEGESSAQNDKSESSSELVREEVNLPQEKDDEDNAVCSACGGHDVPEGANVVDDAAAEDIFWIFCELCNRWFHGQCVFITAAIAENIKLYRCPSCRTRRAQP